MAGLLSSGIGLVRVFFHFFGGGSNRRPPGVRCDATVILSHKPPAPRHKTGRDASETHASRRHASERERRRRHMRWARCASQTRISKRREAMLAVWEAVRLGNNLSCHRPKTENLRSWQKRTSSLFGKNGCTSIWLTAGDTCCRKKNRTLFGSCLPGMSRGTGGTPCRQMLQPSRQ